MFTVAATLVYDPKHSGGRRLHGRRYDVAFSLCPSILAAPRHIKYI